MGKLFVSTWKDLINCVLVVPNIK